MARRLKNAPQLTAYLNQLKKDRRQRTLLKNAEVQENKRSYERRKQAKIREAIDNMPRTPQQYREKVDSRRDMMVQKATMTEAQREEYGAPKTPKRPMIARSFREAADAYQDRKFPGYRQERLQYERYLREHKEKTPAQRELEDGRGPRKGYVGADDYRKVQMEKRRNKANKR